MEAGTRGNTISDTVLVKKEDSSMTTVIGKELKSLKPSHLNLVLERLHQY